MATLYTLCLPIVFGKNPGAGMNDKMGRYISLKLKTLMNDKIDQTHNNIERWWLQAYMHIISNKQGNYLGKARGVQLNLKAGDAMTTSY